MADISSDEIDRFIETRLAMVRNYCGTYAIDQLVNDFVGCASRIETKVKGAKLPFAVVNTDPIAESGTHWFSFIRLQGNSFFLFDSFGLVGFKAFVETDDTAILESFLLDFDTQEQGDVSFYSFTFDASAFLELTPLQRSNLSKTCRGIMTFLTAFAVAIDSASIRIYGIIETCRGIMTFLTAFAAAIDSASIRIYGIIDQLQVISTSTCGGFVLYYLEQVYENSNATICKYKSCTVRTM